MILNIFLNKIHYFIKIKQQYKLYQYNVMFDSKIVSVLEKNSEDLILRCV